MHFHFIVAGCLLSWALVGVDPIPRRPSLHMRGAVLVAALVLHTALSKIMIADADRLAEATGQTAAQWVTAAEIMWYEGDLIDVALLFAFVVQAHSVTRRRRLRRQAARALDRATPPASVPVEG